MVKIVTEVKDDDLWSEVFGGGYEFTGWTEVEHLDGGEWRKAGRAKVTIRDPEDDYSVVGEKVVTIEDIAAAVSATGHDWENLDAITSDAILQYAVLGEVVFG